MLVDPLSKSVTNIGSHCWVAHKAVFLIRKPIFVLYVGWCDSKNEYQKYMCLKDIRLPALDKLTILSLILEVIERG